MSVASWPSPRNSISLVPRSVYTSSSQMRREGARVLEDLKHFIKHGRAHPRKLVQANPSLPVPE